MQAHNLFNWPKLIEPQATMDDLILPERERQLLKSMMASIRDAFESMKSGALGQGREGWLLQHSLPVTAAQARLWEPKSSLTRFTSIFSE